METQTETEVHKIYAMLVVLVFDDFGDTTKFCENLLRDWYEICNQNGLKY